jgi:hypothetical protein
MTELSVGAFDYEGVTVLDSEVAVAVAGVMAIIATAASTTAMPLTGRCDIGRIVTGRFLGQRAAFGADRRSRRSSCRSSRRCSRRYPSVLVTPRHVAPDVAWAHNLGRFVLG